LSHGARQRLVRDLSTAGGWGGRWPRKEAPEERDSWRRAKCLLTSLLSSQITTPLWINQEWSDSQGLLQITVFIHPTHPHKGMFPGDPNEAQLSP